jgi:hypothetical protein
MTNIYNFTLSQAHFWGMHTEYISLSQSLGHRQAPVHKPILQDSNIKNKNILVVILITLKRDYLIKMNYMLLQNKYRHNRITKDILFLGGFCSIPFC